MCGRAAPFEAGQIFPYRAVRAPIVSRVEMLWKSMRARSSRRSRKRPDFQPDKEAYLRFVDEIYRTDAYHCCPLKATQSRPAWLRECGRAAGTPSMTLVIAEIATPSRRGILASVSAR